MMYWQNWHMAAGGWLVMTLFLVLLLALVAAVTYLIARFAVRPPDRTTPRALLDEQLARGEIDPEEYRVRCALLVKNSRMVS